MLRINLFATDNSRQPLISGDEQAALISQGRAFARRQHRRPADDGRPGGVPSPHLADGLDFAEHRHYQPGDDPRRIDWRVTARTGQTHTRRYHDDRSADCLLLVDRRATMRFATRARLKATQAARLAIALAACYTERQVQVQVLIVDEALHSLGPVGRAAVAALARSLAAPCPPSDTSGPALDQALTRIERQALPGTRVMLLSDFHDAALPRDARWHHLNRRYPLHRIHVVDPAEINPPSAPQAQLGWTLRRGDFGTAVTTADSARLANAYHARQQQLHTLPGHDHALLTTDSDLAPLLRALT